MDFVPGLPKGEAGGEQEILFVVHDQDPSGDIHNASFGAFLPDMFRKSYAKRMFPVKINEFSRMP